MATRRARLWLPVLAVASGLAVCAAGPARAQLGALATGNRYELSETVRLDRADTSVHKLLERVKTYLNDKRWDEAVDTLVQVTENSGNKLLGVTERRYVSVRDYCNLQMSLLPPEALTLYRTRVDPQARKWCDDGIATRNRQLLLKVVDRAFASSWGDRALLALGEMALETGDYAGARACWETIVPADAPANVPRTWLRFPDSKLDLAAVRARLVLTSILEGSPVRAKEELARLEQLHPGARGWFGGRKGNYAAALEALLVESSRWAPRPVSTDWPTFAGSAVRSKILPEKIDVGRVQWRVPLRETVAANKSIWGTRSTSQRVAEDAAAPLSYHPLVLGNLVLVNNQVEILAVDLGTGKPVWGHRGPAIYEDQFEEAVRALYNPSDNLGVPRFTMTAHRGKLYARMGSAVTARPHDASMAGGSSYLVCLDLAAQGRLVWRIAPEEKGWAFEGSPLVDSGNVYVVMRRSDIQPQVHVACYDAETGRLRWRQFLCASETPARGMLHETTHNLLTLARETLYVNTNLGAVAALSARDGRIEWVSLYPRVRQGDLIRPEPYTCRDLNPCVYDRGRLLVAPADSRRILALDALTGQILWQTGTEVEDVVHLLGVAGDWLIASGHRLYWISLKEQDQGKVKRVWPDSHERPGFGRGILAGGCVWWPTRDKIYLFDQYTGQQKKAILLEPRAASGGNLLIAPGRLLIATHKELIALGEGGTVPTEPKERIPTL